MFYEAEGEFSDCGYELSSDMSGWQLVVVTGSADSSDSSTGTSTFYIGAEGASSMTLCGTADKVVSGNTWHRLGWPGQGPGKVAAAYEWNRILSKAELDLLLRAGVEQEHADRKRLGMFYEADGEFSDCGYEISSDMSGWQLVVVTGSADSPDSITGTSTFYLGAEGASSMTLCGTVDKVVSGNNWYRLGWPGQGPGKVAAAYEWNRILSKAELDQLLRAGVEAAAVSLSWQLLLMASPLL
eukprot:TRINITY_DN6741_c0_g1_i7.p1 TRINITY_DN6741_c0_g1~~TRINITY_DN6741_c0_g1_i7.p1  ORF type:complete len:275 (+),score=57.00 TRINITY_DN6741_c0_g1_i7:103-825(+)